MTDHHCRFPFVDCPGCHRCPAPVIDLPPPVEPLRSNAAMIAAVVVFAIVGAVVALTFPAAIERVNSATQEDLR